MLTVAMDSLNIFADRFCVTAAMIRKSERVLIRVRKGEYDMVQVLVPPRPLPLLLWVAKWSLTYRRYGSYNRSMEIRVLTNKL